MSDESGVLLVVVGVISIVTLWYGFSGTNELICMISTTERIVEKTRRFDNRKQYCAQSYIGYYSDGYTTYDWQDTMCGPSIIDFCKEDK